MIVIAFLLSLAISSENETANSNWGPTSLAIVHLKKSTRRTDGDGCFDLKPDEVCLGTTFFLQAGRIVKIIAATPAFTSSLSRTFKVNGGHASRFARGGTYLALLEETTGGYTWIPWKESVNSTTVCVDHKTIDAMPIPRLALPPNSDGDYCFHR